MSFHIGRISLNRFLMPVGGGYHGHNFSQFGPKNITFGNT